MSYIIDPNVQKIDEPRKLLVILDEIYKQTKITFENSKHYWKYNISKYNIKLYPKDIYFRLIQLNYNLTKKDFVKFIKYNIDGNTYKYRYKPTSKRRSKTKNKYGKKNNSRDIYSSFLGTWMHKRNSIIGYTTIIDYFFDKYKLNVSQFKKLTITFGYSSNNELYWYKRCIEKKLINYMTIPTLKIIVSQSADYIKYLLNEIIEKNISITKDIFFCLISNKYLYNNLGKVDKILSLLDTGIDIEIFNMVLYHGRQLHTEVIPIFNLILKYIKSVNIGTIKLILTSYDTNFNSKIYWDYLFQNKLINHELIKYIINDEVWTHENKNKVFDRKYSLEQILYRAISNYRRFQRIDILHFIVKHNYPITKNLLDILLRWNTFYKYTDRGNILELYKKHDIAQDYDTLIELIISYPQLSDISNLIKLNNLKMDKNCLIHAVRYSSPDIVKYIISHNIPIDKDVYNEFLKRDKLYINYNWLKSKDSKFQRSTEYILMNQKQEILDLILKSNIKLGNKELHELIIKYDMEDLSCFDVLFDENTYFHIHQATGNVGKYAKYFNNIDVNKLILREMFKNEKLSTIKQYIQDKKVYPDRYCFENVYKQKNKKQREEIINYLIGINCKPSIRCLKLGMTHLSVQSESYHKIFDILSEENNVNAEYMCVEASSHK